MSTRNITKLLVNAEIGNIKERRITKLLVFSETKPPKQRSVTKLFVAVEVEFEYRLGRKESPAVQYV